MVRAYQANPFSSRHHETSYEVSNLASDCQCRISEDPLLVRGFSSQIHLARTASVKNFKTRLMVVYRGKSHTNAPGPINQEDVLSLARQLFK